MSKRNKRSNQPGKPNTKPELKPPTNSSNPLMAHPTMAGWAVVVGVVGVAVAIALGLPGAIVATWQLSQSPAIATPTVAPAKADESLILVADFENQSKDTQSDIQPAEQLYNQIKEHLTKDNLSIRVEHLQEILNETTAKSTGEAYSATLLLWGKYDGLSIKPAIERFRKATYLSRAKAELISLTEPTTIRPAISSLESNQASYVVLLTLSLEQFSSGNLTESLRYLDIISTTLMNDQMTSQNKSDFYFWRGITYFYKGDAEQAIENYTQAINLRPDFAEAYCNRAVIYGSKHDFAREIEDSNQAIKFKPNLVEAYRNRGNAYNDSGQYDQAIENYTQAINLRPDFAEAFYARGAVYYQQPNHDYVRAVDDAQQAIKLKPDFAWAYVLKGFINSIDGYYGLSLTELDHAIELSPDLAAAYSGRGRAYIYYRNYDRAILNYNQALKLDPNMVDVYFSLGFIYQTKEDYPEAIINYKKFLELGKSPDLRAQATEALAKLGAQP